jgi:beta-lactam-binding protein with PASTA domain
LICLLGAGAYFGWKAIQGLFHGEVIEIPDFRGKSLTYVLENKPDGIELELLQKQESRKVKPNIVIDQNPSPGSKVKTGRRLFLVVSMGSDVKEVSSVVGLDLRIAGLRLRRLGLMVGNIAYRFADPGKRGKVLAQTPREGVLVPEGMKISLLVGSMDSPEARIPNLRGLILSQARLIAQSQGWLLEPNYERSDPSQSDDTVLDQDPLPGLKITSEEKKILVWVNRRNKDSEIPRTGMVRERVEIRIPAGLDSKDLRVELVDFQGSRDLHHQAHPPESFFFLDVEYHGTGHLNLFLDGLFYRKIELVGESYGSDSR